MLEDRAVGFPVEELRPLARRMFDELRRMSFDGIGVTRESFGPLETAAQDLIARVASENGLQAERDRARNLVVTLPGLHPQAPFIATGSHLDSVPQGGNYDGAAGVVAGLLAMIGLKRAGITPARAIRLIALRGEESCWYGKSWIGSHALFGRLTGADLARKRYDNGRPLQAYLEDVGADVPAIARGERLLDPAQIAAFLEVHIEQGPVLEAKGLPLGIVTGIYGNLRHMNVVCRGQAAHAGAAPRFIRRDAVVAIADLIMRMDEHWTRALDQGRQLVITHGIVGTNAKEHAVSRVPGEACLSVEIRADDHDILAGFHRLLQSEAEAVGTQRGVSFTFDEAIVNPPAPMDARWAARFERICMQEGIPHMRLPSGAGHDAAVFAHAGVPTAMLFIRNANGSHNPDEHMEVDDFMLATRVLASVLLTTD
ncbi:MAG: Zn-dependent hydrolase [Burkholderiales bacterium]|nr:Zn-dependent hydrolase [Burkholderiales bacterium]